MYISRKKRNRQEYIKEQGVVGNASEQLRSVDLFAEDAQTINADLKIHVAITQKEKNKPKMGIVLIGEFQ